MVRILFVVRRCVIKSAMAYLNLQRLQSCCMMQWPRRCENCARCSSSRGGEARRGRRWRGQERVLETAVDGIFEPDGRCGAVGGGRLDSGRDQHSVGAGQGHFEQVGIKLVRRRRSASVEEECVGGTLSEEECVGMDLLHNCVDGRE